MIENGKKNNCQVHFMGLQYNNFTHIPSLLTIMTEWAIVV